MFFLSFQEISTRSFFGSTETQTQTQRKRNAAVTVVTLGAGALRVERSVGDLWRGRSVGSPGQVVWVMATQTFLEFSPRKLGKVPILTSIFFKGVVQPPTSC